MSPGAPWLVLLSLAVLALAPAGCGGDASEACAQAEGQVTDCLDSFCADDDGAFCRCHASGQHLVASGCQCEDGTYWETIQESVCEELDFEPDLDCKGLRATIARFERVGACD